jgi:uncharacterized protein involved in exopolysaccharide biosynthesis
MQISTTTRADAPTPLTEDEPSLLDFLVVLGRNKLLVFGLALAAGILGYAVSFLLPVEYRASTLVASSKDTPAALLRSVA